MMSNATSFVRISKMHCRFSLVVHNIAVSFQTFLFFFWWFRYLSVTKLSKMPVTAPTLPCQITRHTETYLNATAKVSLKNYFL